MTLIKHLLFVSNRNCWAFFYVYHGGAFLCPNEDLFKGPNCLAQGIEDQFQGKHSTDLCLFPACPVIKVLIFALFYYIGQAWSIHKPEKSGQSCQPFK